MANCPTCAEPIPDGTPFCPHCRTDLGGPPPAQAKASGAGTSFLIRVVAALAIAVVCGGLAALLIRAIGSFREEARKSNSNTNMKLIGIAVHDYHDVHGSFPISNEHRREHGAEHSWQTYLLPFIEECPLYDSIDFAQAWDHPANSHAFRKQVIVYINPGMDEKFESRGYALSHYAGNSHLLPHGFRLDEVTDGTSNTILAGEVKDGPRPWGDPENLRDPARGLNAGPDTFGSPWKGGVQILALDGAVYFLDDSMDRETLRARATPQGGEVHPP